MSNPVSLWNSPGSSSNHVKLLTLTVFPHLALLKVGSQKLLPDWTEPSYTVFHWPGHLMNNNADPNIEIIDSR